MRAILVIILGVFGSAFVPLTADACEFLHSHHGIQMGDSTVFQVHNDKVVEYTKDQITGLSGVQSSRAYIEVLLNQVSCSQSDLSGIKSKCSKLLGKSICRVTTNQGEFVLTPNNVDYVIIVFSRWD